MASDLSPAVKAAAEAMSRVATAAGFRLREQRHVLARAAVEAALPHLAAELAASTVTTSTPLDGWTLHAEDGDVELTHDCPGWDRYGVVKCFDAAPLAEVVAAITEHTCPDPAARVAEGGERRG